jgi:hypothetical protein
MRLVGGFGERRTPGNGERSGTILSRCANPHCATGWMRLWRNRRVPGFEGRWACSAECMQELVAASVRREMDGGDSTSITYAHRVPMGLMLVEQGRISPAELEAALDGQRRAAQETGETGQLGQWLLRSGVLSEPALTRALSVQWNCPVFSLAGYRPEDVASSMPRFFSDALGALPVRVAGRRLHVAFSGHVDRSLTYAMKQMSGLAVDAGVACDSEFRKAQKRFLETPAPETRFLEAGSSWVLVRAITKMIESEKPEEARLARIHEYYWLRLWRRVARGAGLAARNQVADLLCTVGTARRTSQ